MGFLTKEQILAAEDLKHEDIKVPEWGGTVRVRALTALEKDNFDKTTFMDTEEGDSMNWEGMRARLVSLTVINDKGERLFTSNDVVELGKKSAIVMDKVFAVAQRLSGFTKEEVKEIEKN